MRYEGRDIPDKVILNYIQRSKRFREKVFRMFGGAGGKAAAANMTPEARKARAEKAVAAREKKRALNKED